MEKTNDTPGLATFRTTPQARAAVKESDRQYPIEFDAADEGAYFALHTDSGNARSEYKGAAPNKGSFFGLHTDWGKPRGD